MSLIISVKTFVGWIVVTAVLALAIGIAIGGGYAIHQADAMIDSLHAKDNEDYAALKKNFDIIMETNGKLQDALRSALGTGQHLLDRVNQDDAAAAEGLGDSTVIYERSPELQIRFTGIRGLPVIPLPGQGQQLPRVLIPGRVHPLILAPDGDARQAVIYYLDKHNRMRGPYLPEVVRPQ